LGENDRSEQLTQLRLISPREKTKLLMWAGSTQNFMWKSDSSGEEKRLFHISWII